MPLKFVGKWRFGSPGALNSGAQESCFQLINRIAVLGNRKDVMEHFKSYFAGAVGRPTGSSSSADWAASDLKNLMDEASANAPLFIEAFYDACEALRKEDLDVPDVADINHLLAGHDVRYEIQPPNLVALDEEAVHESRGVSRTVSATSDISAVVHSPLSRKLKVFLCHARENKSEVRELYERLQNDGFQPWLDEEDLLPGQDWQKEIPKAVRASDVVIVCLSDAFSKAGYRQKEVALALDVAEEQPEDTIFVVPLKLKECAVPARLSRWQWVDLFKADGYAKLMRSLRQRAESLDLG
jgi:hypothetical protein